MLTFMDYIVHAFGTSTDWNHDNSYSALTWTSDSLLSFETPSSLSLNVSSLSTTNFATSYTLSTVGQIDGSISYLYTSLPLGHIPSRTPRIPLRNLVRGYRDIKLPVNPDTDTVDSKNFLVNGRKPTLLQANLALPPPSTLTALYARRINPRTLLSVSLNSKSGTSLSAPSNPPAASLLAHFQYDTGRYSVEGLGSTDNALFGFRGLYNFGVGPPKVLNTFDPGQIAGDVFNPDQIATEIVDGMPDIGFPSVTPPSPSRDDFDTLASHRQTLLSKPSLLSAGAEFYYSPLSHVIGLSTGLRFTTLTPLVSSPNTPTPLTPAPTTTSSSKPLTGTSAALSSSLLTPVNIPYSSFPYTMTLTMTPLTGSLASTYSVRPTPHLALSSRFDFNVYSWESQYVLGAEIWRGRTNSSTATEAGDDTISWAKKLATDWFTPEEKKLKEERIDRESENVVKFRIDDGWNIKALWTGRVNKLLVSAGVSLSPVHKIGLGTGDVHDESVNGVQKKWTGTFGVEVAYST